MSAHVSAQASIQTVRVRLENAPRWLQVELSLNGQWDGGPLINYANKAAVNLQAADDLSRTYDLKTWEAGMMSGAFYAYRTLPCPRSRIVIATLEGSLGSDDMSALAGAIALGVTKLVSGNSSSVDISDWKIRELSLSGSRESSGNGE